MKIAYLAPEITGLSATFVYKEIIGIEAHGHEVVPYSIHKQGDKAAQTRGLADRVEFVYQVGMATRLGSLFMALLSDPKGTVQNFNRLLGDISRIEGFVARSKLFYQFISGVWLGRRLKKQDVEHLHIHFGHVPTQIGMYAAMQVGIPFSFTVHANDLFQRPLLYREKGQRAKHVIAISEYNTSRLAEHGVEPAKMTVVRCGVNSEEFEFAPNTEWPTSISICVVGRLVSKKGIDTLIKAIALLRDEEIDVNLEIAGDGPLKESLVELRDNLNLTERVRFIGKISNDKIPEWFSRQHIFALPARKDENGDMDGIPVVLMEAMSCGIPVISTRISGIPELVVNNETGILVNPDEPDRIAEGVRRLMESSSFRENLRSKALERVKSEFGVDVNVRRLMALFTS